MHDRGCPVDTYCENRLKIDCKQFRTNTHNLNYHHRHLWRAFVRAVCICQRLHAPNAQTNLCDVATTKKISLCARVLVVTHLQCPTPAFGLFPVEWCDAHHNKSGSVYHFGDKQSVIQRWFLKHLQIAIEARPAI